MGTRHPVTLLHCGCGVQWWHPLTATSPCLAHKADDNATIRVTNLSEDTRETDLQELFRPFGSISRIYLAKDKTTGQSKVSELGWGVGSWSRHPMTHF